MRSLVTGGGGFLGRAIAERLVALGDRVRCFARGAYPDLESLGIEVLRGDLTDRQAVEHACAGMDRVFHTAAIPGVWGSWELFHSINTRGTEHVIAGCRAHGVRSLIYTSSPSVVFDGQPHENADESLPYSQRFLCHYPHTKALAEQLVRAAHGPELATVALRPHLIWGPRDNHLIPRLVQRAKNGRLIRVGDGSNRISMTFIDNAAIAHVQAATALTPTAACGGQAYFINDPESVNLWDWVGLVLQRAGLPPVRRHVSARAAGLIGRACETTWSVLRLSGEPPLTRFVASQLSQTHTYSIAAAQRDFGYTPCVSMSEGLDRLQPDLERLAADQK